MYVFPYMYKPTDDQQFTIIGLTFNGSSSRMINTRINTGKDNGLIIALSNLSIYKTWLCL